MSKTFVLGVGGQKCGTSWLWQQLSQHPHAMMDGPKEQHLFDSLYVPSCRLFLRPWPPRRPWSRKSVRNYMRRVWFATNPHRYFDHFSHRLAAVPGPAFVADMTPSYAALPPDALRMIVRSFSDRGVVVKPLFLIRDPVERCISAARMKADLLHDKTSGAVERILRTQFDSDDYCIRTRYDRTIENLESIFEVNDICIEFFEELFSRQSMARILQRLGLPMCETSIEQPVNRSTNRASVSEGLRREIFHHYRCVYEFVATRAGNERLAALWPSYREFA